MGQLARVDRRAAPSLFYKRIYRLPIYCFCCRGNITAHAVALHTPIINNKEIRGLWFNHKNIITNRNKKSQWKQGRVFLRRGLAPGGGSWRGWGCNMKALQIVTGWKAGARIGGARAILPAFPAFVCYCIIYLHIRYEWVQAEITFKKGPILLCFLRLSFIHFWKINIYSNATIEKRPFVGIF